jgi:hypothetical protein
LAIAQTPVLREVSEQVCAAISTELRMAIRGRTVEDLSSLTGQAPSAVEGACELLVARGQAMRRGAKFFAA